MLLDSLTNEELREALDEIFQLAHIGFWELDASTLRAYWSDNTCDIVGVERGTVGGLDVLEELVSQEDYVKIRASLKSALLKGTPHTMTYPVVRRDNGEVRWVECRARRKLDTNGKPFALYGTVQDITFQRLSQQEKEKDRLILQSLFEQAEVGMMLVEKKNRIVRVNQRLASMLQYDSPEELNGRYVRVMHMSDESFDAFVHQQIPRVKQGPIHSVEFQIRRKDGTPLWVELSGRVLDKQIPADIEKGVLWIVQDISLRKEYQIKLIRSELLKKNLLDTVPDMVWLKDLDGVYLACNPEFELFFGAQESDIIGKTDYDFVDKELADFFRMHDRNAMEAGKPTVNEEWITYASDGRRVLLETTKAPLRDAYDRTLGVMGIGHDITLRHLQAAALKDAKELAEALSKEQSGMLSLFEKGDVILFKWSNEEHWPVTHVSGNVQELFGYSREEFLSGDLLYSDCIHPDDLERVTLEVKQALEDDSDFFKHTPYRILHGGKTTRWIMDSTVTLRNEVGCITHFIGYIFDITERKVRESIKEFRESLEHIAHDESQKQIFSHALTKALSLTESKGGLIYIRDGNGSKEQLLP